MELKSTDTATELSKENSRHIRIPITQGGREYRVTCWRNHLQAVVLISGPCAQADAPTIAARFYGQFLETLEQRQDEPGSCRAKFLIFDGKLRWLNFIKKGERFEGAVFRPPLPSEEKILNELSITEEAKTHAQLLSWRWPPKCHTVKEQLIKR